jgi:hypothetical protein
VSKKTKTKTKTTPWDPAAIKAGESALQSGYGQAQGTIAQYSPALNSAIGQIQQNIATPPSYVTDARNELDKTIKGDYLDPSTNPYSEGMAKLIADRTQGNYNATFGASGRAHGGLAAQLSTQGVGDALNSFYGNIYNTERGRQYGATLAEPGFHQDEYTDINQLFPAVANTANLPLNAANTYAGGLSGLLSPYNTSTTTQKQSMLPQILGLAAQAAGAFATGGASLAGGAGGLGGLLAAPMATTGLSSAVAPYLPGGLSGALGYLPGFGG